jgi:hypothetical protein
MKGRINIMLRDDDAPGSAAAVGLSKAADRWHDDEIRYVFAMPWAAARGDKSDFNDVLRAAPTSAEGLAAIAQRIRPAVLYADDLAPAAPPFSLPTATTEELRIAVRDEGRAFFAAARDRHPDDAAAPVQLKAPTGSGKSEMTGRELVGAVDSNPANRFAVLAPNHHLLRQLAERYQEHGQAGTIAIYEGRAGKLPDRPPLCDDLDAVEIAIKAGANVTETVCGPKDPAKGPRCRFRDQCRYFARLEEAKAASIVLTPQNFLFDGADPPAGLFKNLAAVVVEEDFTGQGRAPVKVLRAAFDTDDEELGVGRYPAWYKKGGRRQNDVAATTDLRLLYGKIRRALAEADDRGQGLAAALVAVGLSASDLRQAIAVTWKRQIDLEMRPGMPLEDRKAAAKKNGSINLTIRQIVRVLQAFEQLVADDASPALWPQLDRDNPPIIVGAEWITVYRLRETAGWLDGLPVVAPRCLGIAIDRGGDDRAGPARLAAAGRIGRALVGDADQLQCGRFAGRGAGHRGAFRCGLIFQNQLHYIAGFKIQDF